MIKKWSDFNESKKIDKIDEDEFLGQKKLEEFVNREFIEDVVVVVLKYEDNVYDDLAKEINKFKKEYLSDDPWTNGYLFWINEILYLNSMSNKRSYGETIYVINKLIDFYNRIVEKTEIDENKYPVNKRLNDIHNIIQSSLDEDNLLEFGDYYETKSGAIMEFYTKSQINIEELQKIHDEIKMIESRIEEFNLSIYDVNMSIVRSKEGKFDDYKSIICCLK